MFSLFYVLIRHVKYSHSNTHPRMFYRTFIVSKQTTKNLVMMKKTTNQCC